VTKVSFSYQRLAFYGIVGAWMLVMLTAACGGTPTTPSPSPLGPTVTLIVPSMGPTESSVDIRIVGTRFEPGATVTMDGPLANVAVASSTLITATAQPHPAGAVDIIVTNPDGRSARLPGGYLYVPVAVTFVSPRQVSVGSPLTITGTGFLPGAAVTIGGVAAQVTAVAPTVITATVPSHADGVVDVVVTNPGGQSASLAAALTIASLTLTVTPDVVAPGGRLTVTWTAPSGQSSLDWIGMFRVGAQNTDYGFWIYTDGATAGTWALNAPGQPGEYEFRYLLDDWYVDVARSRKVFVRD
jgi:hypothetical protein